ncbi:hypothetical protein SLS62_000137 [Diatrype stigma]|uniref:Uncharacterized protein n=1 Tax=Diatrype stigma TaxID=117547 RepID=A0AAN9YX63_9PEZI
MCNPPNMSSKHPRTPKHQGRSSRIWTDNPSPSPGSKKKRDESELVEKLRRTQLSNEYGEEDTSSGTPKNTANKLDTSSETPGGIAIDRDMLTELSMRFQNLLEAIGGLRKRPTRGKTWDDVLKEMDSEVREVRGHVEIMEGVLDADLEALRDV